MTQTISSIDVRGIAPHERHPLIFSTFGTWRVAIPRTAADAPGRTCCGSCGGA